MALKRFCIPSFEGVTEEGVAPVAASNVLISGDRNSRIRLGGNAPASTAFCPQPSTAS
jgi:hypothetical protein